MIQSLLIANRSEIAWPFICKARAAGDAHVL
jgi:acetyl/propionyl-CoA carboxylase alpha subunit